MGFEGNGEFGFRFDEDLYPSEDPWTGVYGNGYTVGIHWPGSSVVERRPEEPGVASSILAWATTLKLIIKYSFVANCLKYIPLNHINIESNF